MLAVAIMVSAPGGGVVRLHLVEVQNDMTGTLEVGNYDVRLKNPETVSKTARIEGHVRAEGALALAAKAIKAVTP